MVRGFEDVGVEIWIQRKKGQHSLGFDVAGHEECARADDGLGGDLEHERGIVLAGFERVDIGGRPEHLDRSAPEIDGVACVDNENLYA